jgi:hypothetical protein
MPQGFALLTEERPSNLSLDKLPRSSMQTKVMSLRIGHATSVAPIRSRMTKNGSSVCCFAILQRKRM